MRKSSMKFEGNIQRESTYEQIALRVAEVESHYKEFASFFEKLKQSTDGFDAGETAKRDDSLRQFKQDVSQLFARIDKQLMGLMIELESVASEVRRKRASQDIRDRVLYGELADMLEDVRVQYARLLGEISDHKRHAQRWLDL